MRCRNYKYFIFRVLVLLGAVSVFPFGGCTDDPQNADSKQIRQETTDALQMVDRTADPEALQSARNKIQSSLVKYRQADQITKDAAMLASGNLALARGRGMMNDLGLKTMPVRKAVSNLERTLGSAESLLVEKERIEGILSSGQTEMTQLEQLVKGTADKPGMQTQLQAVQTQLDQLKSQKTQEQAKQEKTQAVLDDYQARADDLLRKAELSNGDEKLKLQKQAYAIMKDRKDSYIEVQASEDAIASLDSQIELAQSKLDNLTQSIQDIQGRIKAIDTSSTRIALKQQQHEVEQELSVTQQQLTSDAKAITTELDAFKNAAKEVGAVFEEAANEFKGVRSRDASFTANLQLAESYHLAAAAAAAVIKLQLDTSDRLNDVVNTTEPVFAELLREQLPITMSIDTEQSDQVMALYDQAIETYQKALDAAGSMGKDAQCSVLKSELLAADSKMRLADRLNLPDIAEKADAKCQELKEKGKEYGVSFTQSETLNLVDYGIDYTPSLPVNLEVLADELATRFSAWKRLPLAEQEEAVKANLEQITELIDKYGAALAEKLEPLKQEMLAAQERGFKAPVGGGIGEPNSL